MPGHDRENRVHTNGVNSNTSISTTTSDSSSDVLIVDNPVPLNTSYPPRISRHRRFNSSPATLENPQGIDNPPLRVRRRFDSSPATLETTPGINNPSPPSPEEPPQNLNPTTPVHDPSGPTYIGYIIGTGPEVNPPNSRGPNEHIRAAEESLENRLRGLLHANSAPVAYIRIPVLYGPPDTPCSASHDNFMTEASRAPTYHPRQQETIRLQDEPFHPENIKKRRKEAGRALRAAEARAKKANKMAGPSRLQRGSTPANPNQEQLAAQLQGFMAQAPGIPNFVSVPHPSQRAGSNLVAQLQDLAVQPGGIPDVLPPLNLAHLRGFDLRFVPLLDGRLTNLPPPPPFPLPDLQTQFRTLMTRSEFSNVVEAVGSAEDIADPPPPTKLVVVCCLATWMGTRETHDTWTAMPAQGTRKGWGMDMANSSERECWRRHIWKGLEVLKEMDGEGELVFSGGPWCEGNNISAAQSYYNLARASNFWSYFRASKYEDYRHRIFTENRAMDSLQNVMFSLIEFNHRHGNFPEEMTVISYELKRARFEQLHFQTAKELMLPTSQAEIDVSWQGVPTFIGIDPRELREYSKSDKAAAMMELEAQVFDIWKGSPFGLSGALVDKRKMRNKWGIDLNYPLVLAGGAELVAALEREAKDGPPIEEVVDMSMN